MSERRECISAIFQKGKGCIDANMAIKSDHEPDRPSSEIPSAFIFRNRVVLWMPNSSAVRLLFHLLRLSAFTMNAASI